MEGTQRDRTEDWLIPAGSAPPSVSQLERRIEQALAIAKSSEAAAIAIGDAALEAASQANRAADLAARASAAALDAKRAVLGGGEGEVVANGSSADARLRGFSERADRLTARLLALGPPPAPHPSASVGAGSRQPVG